MICFAGIYGNIPQKSYNFNLISNTPYEIYLFLLPIQAFFLVFALDCLDVIKKSNFKNSISHNNLTINEIWETFLLNDQNFPYKYAVYHKLRSKGWILKCGLKYGCDFSNT